MCTYLDFEGVSVIGAWREICMHSGTPAEWAWVGAIIIKSKAVPVTCTIWTACYSTWRRQSGGWQLSSKVHNHHLDTTRQRECWNIGWQSPEGILGDPSCFCSPVTPSATFVLRTTSDISPLFPQPLFPQPLTQTPSEFVFVIWPRNAVFRLLDTC